MTARQEEYLLLFASLEGRDKSVTGAADYFNVRKSTVSILSDELVKQGYLAKNRHGEISLTDHGYESITAKLDQWQILSRWYQEQCGLVPMLAEKEARTQVVNMSQEALQGILGYIDSIGHPLHTPERTTTALAQPGQLPFAIYKADETTLSMGDGGFSKPAHIVQEQDGLYVVLTPKSIQYHPQKHRLSVSGQLKRLWYRHKDCWVESSVRTDGRHYIPLDYVDIDEASKIGRLRIRARASVGVFIMPEGEATMLFQFQAAPNGEETI